MAKSNSSWLKTLSIGFSIISFGITLAIVGYFVLTTKQNQTANQTSPTSALDEAASWKTYTNTEDGFQIKYPLQWKYKPTQCDKNLSTFYYCEHLVIDSPIIPDTGTHPVYYELSLYISNRNNKSLQQVSGEYLKNLLPTDKLIERNKTIIDGEEAELFLVLGDVAGGINVLTIHKDKIYRFTFMPYLPSSISKTKWNHYRSTFDQILSTFQFTD